MVVKRMIFCCYSDQHFKTSVFFSKLSFKMESENINKKVSEEVKENNKSYVTGAIISSVAFLESTINELFWSAAKNPTGIAKGLCDNSRAIMAKMYNDFDILKNMSTLDKYQYLLLLNGKELFNKGKNPFQNVSLVIKLRNELVHFEPEKIDAEINIQKLENLLRGKFDPCPFFNTFLFFPHRCLSYGCAKWVVISCMDFVNDFYNTIGINKKYNIDGSIR